MNVNTCRVLSCIKGKKRSILKYRDIQSLWPNKGLTDAIIDFFVRLDLEVSNAVYSLRVLFFCRILLPKLASDITASALSYTAIQAELKHQQLGPADLKRKFLNTNGPIDFSCSPLLFPCCIQ